jgi:SAM-dependent methyltransferase
MDRAHWDDVWRDRVPEEVTWFQAEHEVSRRLIAMVATPSDGIVDVGAGASRLVDHLLADGYADVTVVDIAPASLDAARRRLGAAGDRVRWVAADVTNVEFDRTFDVWHDRAVFHFLVDADDRERYLRTLRAALDPGGHLVLATFGPDGPERCSGLPVRRYGTDLMDATLGPGFERLHDELEEHVAPSGVTQQFLYGVFRRVG